MTEVDATLDFLEQCLKWEHGLGGVNAALKALESISNPRSATLLQAFIVACNEHHNGQSLELATQAGSVLGKVVARLENNQ